VVVGLLFKLLLSQRPFSGHRMSQPYDNISYTHCDIISSHSYSLFTLRQIQRPQCASGIGSGRTCVWMVKELERVCAPCSAVHSNRSCVRGRRVVFCDLSPTFKLLRRSSQSSLSAQQAEPSFDFTACGEGSYDGEEMCAEIHGKHTLSSTHKIDLERSD